MKLNVGQVVSEKNFEIVGMSYIGAPRSNTAMFITKKVEHLLSALKDVTECLVFAEEGTEISEDLKKIHAFHFSKTPQLAYAKFATKFAEERLVEEKKLKFNLMPGGYYVSSDVKVPPDAYIEPNCVIGPDVGIGKNARILAGTVIRRSTIGDNFIANEYAVIGANGFTMAEDKFGHKFRIPTLGRVIIGNDVEIGAHDNISCGSGGNTVIEDNTKIDALVHLGHDVHLHKNVEITAGGIIGGFDVLHDQAYVGLNAALRNRITVGDNVVIGMGSTVIRSVDKDITVAGNPARILYEGNK